MRRYQSQLGSMLGQLQGLTDKAAGGDKASAAALASAMVLPGTNMNAAAQANPALFGSMERSATPTVAAGHARQPQPDPAQGRAVHLRLKTRVITATSGFVGCQVQRNVFCDDGRVLLIERGSHLDGEYRVRRSGPA